MKVAILYASSESSSSDDAVVLLEESVNDFLKDIDTKNVIDIKFSTTVEPFTSKHGEHQIDPYTWLYAMIMYRESAVDD